MESPFYINTSRGFRRKALFIKTTVGTFGGKPFSYNNSRGFRWKALFIKKTVGAFGGKPFFIKKESLRRDSLNLFRKVSAKPSFELQLRTSSNQSLTSIIASVLAKVLDEAASEILSLGLPLSSISIGIAWIQNL